MFSRILFATDGSEQARKALMTTRELATFIHAEVIVVHAYAPVPVLLGAPYYDDLLSEQVSASNEVIEDAVQILSAEGIPVERELLAGSPADAIVQTAEAHHCDLIILGARGLSDLEGLLLGSVSHDVIRHAHCPVLVVR